MLFYMDFKIDLHEWKDEERYASSLDGKITTATAFLYRLYLVSLEKFSSRTIEIVGCNSGLWYVILYKVNEMLKNVNIESHTHI